MRAMYDERHLMSGCSAVFFKAAKKHLFTSHVALIALDIACFMRQSSRSPRGQAGVSKLII